MVTLTETWVNLSILPRGRSYVPRDSTFITFSGFQRLPMREGVACQRTRENGGRDGKVLSVSVCGGGYAAVLLC